MRKAIFDGIIGTLGGLAAFMLGEINGLFYALVAVVVLDYITGFMEALLKKQLSSKVGFAGIAKKILLFVIVMVANIVDVQVIGKGDVLRSATICFFIANESLSILENAGDMGIPLPKKLLDILKQIKNDKEDDK